MTTILFIIGAIFASISMFVLGTLGIAVIWSNVNLTRHFPFTVRVSRLLIQFMGATITAIKTDLFGIKIIEDLNNIDWRSCNDSRIVFVKPRKELDTESKETSTMRTSNSAFNHKTTPHLALFHDRSVQTIPFIFENGVIQNVSAPGSLFNVPVVMVDLVSRTQYSNVGIQDEVNTIISENKGSLVIIIYQFCDQYRGVVRLGRSELNICIGDIV